MTREWFDKYEVQFERIFLFEDVLANFGCFLRRSFVEESLLFLVAVDEYKTTTYTFEKMMSIYNDFIITNAKHEVNISGKYKIAVVKAISTLEEPLISLFDSVYKCIRSDLKEDVFPRYIRSKNFKQFIIARGEEFMKEIAINLNEFDRDIHLIRPSDFNTKYITEQDVHFVKQMLKDSSDWRANSSIRNESSDHYCYISQSNYTMDDRLRKLAMIKFTGYLPVSAAEFLPAFLDRDLAKKWDANLETEELLQVLPKPNNEPFSCVLTCYTVKKAPFLKSRSMQCVLTLLYDQDTRSYIWIGKSTNAYKYPKMNRDTHWFSGIYAYVIHEVNDGSCRYSHVAYVDAGLPLIIESCYQRLSFEARAKGIQNGLLKICRTYSNRMDRPKNDLQAFNILQEYLERNNIRLDHIDQKDDLQSSQGTRLQESFCTISE